ncbi:asparagine--tRNA ligase [Malassezia yamatoensis]|uniref:Required for respiratory growth protein 9, mitochondrial n=1 Tax=Malassezia yamatoensis TaxID=253288 RepID=A0AAJ5YUA4_9BASI|nr:asparagine--tRNA ligase [Malassezia yamatoensis]
MHGRLAIQRVFAPVRCANLHISARVALPRVRRLVSEQRHAGSGDNISDRNADVVAQTDSPASVPWFMREQVVDVPKEEPSSSLAPPIAWVPSYLPVTTDIPPAVANLVDMWTKGPLHGLLARPTPLAEIDDQQWGAVVRASPITVIRPMFAEESVPETGQDWILVVEVRGESIGAVRQVATEVGTYLKHTKPPKSDTQAELSLDQFLGPAQILSDESESKPSRPKGVSRIEHELGTRLPDWQIQKIALSRKFPDGWTPLKKLSQEAQHGLRLLHASDPERFNLDVLSKRFRISPESVRRILKSRWRPSTEAASRQNRRAKLLQASAATAREQEEMAKLYGEIPLEPAMPTQPAEQVANHPVRFEGLVSSADLAIGRARQKSTASRGSGDWCLVDAGWCVVHVMTASARARYRIEDIWRHNGTQSFRASNSSAA